MSVLGTFEGNILNLIDYCKDQLIPDFVNHVVVQVYHLEILQKMVSFTQYLLKTILKSLIKTTTSF